MLPRASRAGRRERECARVEGGNFMNYGQRDTRLLALGGSVAPARDAGGPLGQGRAPRRQGGPPGPRPGSGPRLSRPLPARRPKPKLLYPAFSGSSPNE